MSRKAKISPRAQWILLAVCFCAGVPLTYWLSDPHLRKIGWLYALIAVFAIASDVMFFRILFMIMKRKKVVSRIFGGVGRVLRAIGGRISRAAQKTFGRMFTKNKTFIGGVRERRFVMETREKQEKSHRRKMPHLSKNATERERIRYEYISYVFKKDKDVPSHLTPSEVGKRLDPSGEDKHIFDNYNGARYAE